MNLYACLVHSRGEPVDTASRGGIEQYCVRRGLEYEWFESGAVSVLWTRSDHAASPAIARLGSLVAVGVVRLENREEIAAHLRRDVVAGDLDLILRHYARYGRGAIGDLIGDFSLVIVDSRSGAVLAARDAFGVHTLYHARVGDIVSFASRAECLADGDRYDVDYLAQFAAGAVIEPHRTPYAGVSAVPPASTLLVRGGSDEAQIYWSPANFSRASACDERAAIDEFQARLVHAVGACLTVEGSTWAELSGGLDSSSIVSIAETMKCRGRFPVGVAGTITYVDSVGAGSDERVYSDAIVERFGLRNEQLADYVLLQESPIALPAADLPNVRCLLEARDSATLEILRGAGARVLLSGLGSDHYLVGNMLFFADWIARGEWQRSITEMLRWAAAGRVSFWRLAYLNAVVPRLPAAVRNRIARGVRPPHWIERRQRQRLASSVRSVVAQEYGGSAGRQCEHEIAVSTAAIASAIDHGVIADEMDVRYPFCHRPLVELSLRLPRELIRRPNARKWILREAMKGYLPDLVLGRRWKGAFDGRVAWSLLRERRRVEPLLTRSMLAELGCVDVARLRVALDRATGMDGQLERGSVVNALALEYWLQVRSGRWANHVGAAGRQAARKIEAQL